MGAWGRFGHRQDTRLPAPSGPDSSPHGWGASLRVVGWPGWDLAVRTLLPTVPPTPDQDTKASRAPGPCRCRGRKLRQVALNTPLSDEWRAPAWILLSFARLECRGFRWRRQGRGWKWRLGGLKYLGKEFRTDPKLAQMTQEELKTGTVRSP